MSHEVDIDAAVRRAAGSQHKLSVDPMITDAAPQHCRFNSFNEVDIDAVVARRLAADNQQQLERERSCADIEATAIPNSGIKRDSRRQPLVFSLDQDSVPRTDIVSTLHRKLKIHDDLIGNPEAESPDVLSEELLYLAETNPKAIRQAGRMHQLVSLQYLENEGMQDALIDLSEIRTRATMALRLVVEQAGEDGYEPAVWDLLQHVWAHCELLRQQMCGEAVLSTSQHGATTSAMGDLMRLSFDPNTKAALCTLGALESILSLLCLDHLSHPQPRTRGGMPPSDSQPSFNQRSSMRVHICTILCNMMKGDTEVKETIATTAQFLEIIKQQLDSPVEELVRVTGALLQNISFRVSEEVKVALAEANLMPALVRATSIAKHRNTVLNLTSALWNMSAHSYKNFDGNNKAAFCDADGGLDLLARYVDMRGDEDPICVKILHNAAGILQNVSSYIARQPVLCARLRYVDIYQALSRLLRHRNMPIAVRSACGALWNLSGASDEEREAIRMANIVPLLETLVQGGSDDEKTVQNAHHTLLNLRMVFHPQQAMYSPSTGNVAAGRPFPPRQFSNPETSSAIMDASLLHKEVPGRVSHRRQQRMEQRRRSRDDVRGSHSPSGFNVSMDSLQHSSSENVQGSRTSIDSYGEAPQKPPRLRHGPASNEPGPQPFFHSQMQYVPPEARRTSQDAISRMLQDSWHARSQSDSAAPFTLPPSNHLRRSSPSNRDSAVRTSYGSSVGSSSSLQARYSSSPNRSPASSQELITTMSTSRHGPSSPNRLGSLGELTIKEQTMV